MLQLPDWSFLFQLLLFALLLWRLNSTVFEPYAELLEERRARTSGAEEDAVADRSEADELAKRIDSELSEARTVAAAEADEIRQSTRAAEAEILDSAKTESAARLASLREGIERERNEAAAALKTDAEQLAGQMVSAVLGSASN